MPRHRDAGDPLQDIPGVGPNTAGHLRDIGIDEPSDLRGRDAEELYSRSCEFHECRLDRCVLYVYRCAVYYANAAEHDPELLKWWSWKDDALGVSPRASGGGAS